jgi:hypothetical protein|uniref:Uncharacterized protein n=1 Tax=Picea sitchensis TaxID=3332 RepID=A0A6B9XU41_PICSI|nr:hypothetical protein Q903MT_gene3903 [Picea sitchensis]
MHAVDHVLVREKQWPKPSKEDSKLAPGTAAGRATECHILNPYKNIYNASETIPREDPFGY